MLSTTNCSEYHKNHYDSMPRGFLTPPPVWRSSRCSPRLLASERKPRRSPNAKDDLFHVIHKVPSGDSPYVKAKRVQLIEKDPNKAISLFWAAINSGDRVDSALKDMAVVMKQLDRSDEAIEAIKSFRHLCPSESQESLDNILLELYKRSGRVEEEIEMLQRKLKQLEEGIAFGGKRTKLARSQGKKILITIEKEYSRLLGNLAWAYMQLRDFKSAEENYRKGLSFESDKNKQCNLAVCLMHMNKLTEAKFLLQTVKDSSENENVEESYAKAFERATQMLAELEQGKDLDSAGKITFGVGGIPKVQTQPRCPWPFNGGDRRRRWTVDDAEKSPFVGGKITEVPLTQPRCAWSSNGGDQRKGEWFVENEKGGFCRKLSFEQSTNGDDKQCVATKSLMTKGPLIHQQNQCVAVEESDTPTDSTETSEEDDYTLIITKFHTACNLDPKGAQDDTENLKSAEEAKKDWTITDEVSQCDSKKKSWADMVEEDEEELQIWSQPRKDWGSTDKQFSDENVNANIIPKNQADDPSQMSDTLDMKSGYHTQPENTASIKNQSVKRSLCFYQQQKQEKGEKFCPSPSPRKPLNFGGRRRLQVFQDITRFPASPRG